MEKREDIIQLIFAVVDQLNLQRFEDQRLEKSVEAPLFGGAGKLESLGLINLIVGIEEKVAEAFAVPINLADESSISPGDNPFQTIGSLADHIAAFLKGRSDAS